MIKLSQKSRKALRAIYRGVGSVIAASSLFACDGMFNIYSPDMYGMPYPDQPEYGMPPGYVVEEIVLHGHVINANRPIPGISIWIKDITTTYINLTDHKGGFYFYLPKQDTYTIVFSDIDGNENGQYKQRTIEMTWDEMKALAGSPLIIELEKIDEK